MGANAHNDYADRKNRRKPIVPIHPELAEPLADILDETHGLLVYQEQVLAIAQKVAGYSLGRPICCARRWARRRRRSSTRSTTLLAAGMTRARLLRRPHRPLWDTLVPFSDYGFNKAHSAGYGVVSFWTAYLKANYPSGLSEYRSINGKSDLKTGNYPARS